MSKIKEDSVATMQPCKDGVTFIPNGSPNDFSAGEDFEFTELQALTDCRLEYIKSAPGFRAENIEDMTIPAGTTLRIRASSFRVRSGSILAYYSKSVDKRASAQ